MLHCLTQRLALDPSPSSVALLSELAGSLEPIILESGGFLPLCAAVSAVSMAVQDAGVPGSVVESVMLVMLMSMLRPLPALRTLGTLLVLTTALMRCYWRRPQSSSSLR